MPDSAGGGHLGVSILFRIDDQTNDRSKTCATFPNMISSLLGETSGIMFAFAVQ
jgi:hypothetical protein